MTDVVAGTGALAAVAAAFGVGRVSRRPARPAPGHDPHDPLGQLPPLAPDVADVLTVLRSVAVVLDDSDCVVHHSELAVQLGVVRGHELMHAELTAIARDVRRQGAIVERVLDLPRGPVGTGRLMMSVRAARLRTGHVLLLLEDRTQAERVEAIRRDFVANVSHELKTPVGGIALLAEAVQEASDDPEAVAHFAGRMRGEADRLSRLVKEIVDLSRLQVSDALVDPQEVDVAKAVAEAVDRCRLFAESRHIALDVRSGPGALVFGDRELLVTAVRNLVDNAIAYSDPDSRVGVEAKVTGELVEISVADRGVGIPEPEQERVFERFYRVDPARSRSTGGTGLGLSIVKHTAANHGGEVRLWSEPGQGSTFTLVLPLVSRPTSPPSAPPSSRPSAPTPPVPGAPEKGQP